MPYISVIIPFKNRFHWLEEAVESVLLQSFKDYEIILVDDGSDADYNFLTNINDNRVRYVRQENRGPAAARNLGVELSTGRFVAFLDSDDLWLPNKLEVQLGYMLDNPDIIFSHTSYIRINTKGTFIEEIASGKFRGKVYPRIISTCPIATPTVMIRRDILNEFKFNEFAKIGQDVILWTQISKQYEISGINKPLTKVRIHDNSAAFNIHRNLKGSLNIINHALEYDKDLDIISKRKAYSKLYNIRGRIFLKKNLRNKGIRCFIKGLFSWPVSINNFLMLLQCILPERYFLYFAEISRKVNSLRSSKLL
jgi:glycosyltransferase involved in cell wall biosynthesis